MTYTMICPRCERSREFYEVREIDPETKKQWMVTRCRKCAYNTDIVEASNEIGFRTGEPKRDGDSGKLIS